MRKLLNKSVGVALAVFLLISALIMGLAKIDFALLKVKAEYSRDYSELTDEELDRLSFRSSVSYDSPQITVFTHGYNSVPAHWSSDNNYKFAYEEFSMVEQLCQMLDGQEDESNAIVLKAQVNYKNKPWLGKTYSVEEALSQLTSDTNSDADIIGDVGAASLRNNYNKVAKEADYDTSEKREELSKSRSLKMRYCDSRNKDSYGEGIEHNDLTVEDVSKHIIIIFEALEPYRSNDFVYGQLEYILDVLSYQYCQLTGKLPTYNLIGHSRGGITNLQYALGHPYNVASLYSMGTPYNGSAFGGVSFNGKHPFLSLVGMEKDFDYTDKIEKDYDPGVLDILNTGLNNSYKDFWNSHYSEYSHIAFKPIGSYVTFGFVLQTLIDLLKYVGVDNRAIEIIGRVVAMLGEDILCVCSYLTPKGALVRLIASACDCLKDVVKKYAGSITEPWMQIINNIRTIKVPYAHIGTSFDLTFVYTDDLFIDLDSQIAYGYTGADVRVRLMDTVDQGNIKKSTNEPGVAHNLETHSPDIINYIINDISTGKGEAQPYDIRYVENGCVITNLRFNENKDKSVLRIPEIYKGLHVVGIDRLTRDVHIGGEEKYHSEITKIIIPKTVKTISDYAFYGMNNLKTVEFESGSVLNSLGTGVFMNCKSLTGIVLPNTVKEIGLSTFRGCSALQSFTIGKDVTSVGAGAFAGCNKLAGISVEMGNTVYSTQEGVLFDIQGTQLLAYPQGKTGASYTIPSAVTEIGAYAFAENNKLQSINLNQVTMIRQGGLSRCTALSTITANSLKYVEVGALEETAWFEDNADGQIILGEVLLRYQGSATTVSLQGVSSIAPYAFAENTSLQTLKIDGTLHNIGDGAFFQCENLQHVYVENVNRMVSVGLGVFEGSSATVHIPNVLQDEYKANELWDQYKESLEVMSTVVHFNSEGGSSVSDGILWYGSEVGELPVPTKQENRFIGWKYDDGTGAKFVGAADSWMSTVNTVEFIAEWAPIEYSIVLNTNGGTLTNYFDGKYTSEAGKVLPTPTFEGYNFRGWYNNVSFTGNPITRVESGETGNKTYYAKWEEAEYTVILNWGYDGCPANQNEKVIYNKAFILPVPDNREGFIFNGWRIPGEMLCTDENGESLQKWNIPANMELVADWTRKQYAIQVNSDGTIVWMTESGFSDEKVFIPYGTKFKTTTELEAAFNPDKISLKEGYKFRYFTLKNGTKFTVWTELPDLGDNECIYNIYTYFEKEINFTIDCLMDKELNAWYEPITKNFGESITLPKPTKTGYIFDAWYVMDHAYNREHFAESPLSIGSKFNKDRMPDLSIGKEEDGTHIKLEPHFTPIKVTISYVTYYGSSISPTPDIAYDSIVVLPIPNERRGYAFKGWYFSTDGGNGTGVQCTDAEGKMVSKWNHTVNTKVYAKWEIVSYGITYVLNGGGWGNVSTSNRPTSYTINTPTITLPTPTKTGYRFMGWYTNSSLTGTRVYSVSKGSTGNRAFYAKWSYLYTITFNTGVGSSCASIKGISGESIKLPTSTRSYYTGKWQTNGMTYNFGGSYTILSSTTFTAKWTPIEYKIHYVVFGQELTPPSSESSKQTFTVERDTFFWIPTPADSTWYEFDGWYKESTFTNKVTRTISFNYCDITVYGRWKYVRTNTYTVTDDGVFKQPSDSISFQKLTGYSLAELKAKGYKTITFTGELTAWQKDDGYKYMQVYDGTGENATRIGEWWVDHRDGKTKRVYQLNNDGSWTFDLEALTSETLCFRYTASGKFSDTWYNSNFWLAVKSLT